MNRKMEKLLNGQQENHIFPFLWLHGEPEETLREYMGVVYAGNIRAVCVESRPHPDFCGEQWWRDMDVILDEARKRKMKVWILDDSHFPTGYANGALKDQPDELCRQSICCRIYEPDGKRLHIGNDELLHPAPFVRTMAENYTMEREPRQFDDDRLLALFAVKTCPASGYWQENARMDLIPFIKNGELDWEIPEGAWKVYALHLSRNQGYHRSYINMMDHRSCRVLLDAVYEPHYQHYAADFGSTIAGFFSDEPELGNGHMYEMDDPFGIPNDYPWSRELESRLEESLGSGYKELLALLWETDADPALTARVRYAYMDVVTKLVKEDFSEQIGGWCREHGVKYIGHLIEDDNHHTRTGSSLGHYFRGLAGQDMAGIDDIGGQVFPQGEEISYNRGTFEHRDGEFYHYVLGKLAGSAALEPGKNGDSMCEIFGNYGWEEGIRLEKYLADHFLVRGINHFVPHAFSLKDFPDPDCPPHFYAHGNNPQYRHFGYLMAYMNRVCELISGGRHTAPVAVVYHAEGDWTGNHLTMDSLCHALADGQIGYDVVPQDVFADREGFRTEILDGRLKVHTQEYRAVLVPYMQYITQKLAEAIEELLKNRVPVFFVGGFPEGLCDPGSEAEAGSGHLEKPKEVGTGDRSLEKLMEAGSGLLEKLKAAGNIPADQILELPGKMKGLGFDEIRLSPADDRVRYLRYIEEDGTEAYLFVNEGTQVWNGSISFWETSFEDAVLYEYDAWENRIAAVPAQGNCVSLEIEPLKSRILIFDPSAKETDIPGRAVPFREEMEKTELSDGWKRSICRSIRYPDFEKEKEVNLPDALAEEEPGFSGFVRYEKKIGITEKGQYFLEITDAAEGGEVFVNGKSLGIQVVPAFFFELTSRLQPGENTLRIEVATTLEREMALAPDRLGRTRQAKALSGITGKAVLWKKIVYGRTAVPVNFAAALRIS